MFNELLPIGSVVLLKGGLRKLVIIGVKPVRPEKPENVYDYLGVLYPEGYLGGNSCFLFNHSDINDIIHLGYDNPERKDFLQYMEQAARDRDEQRAEQE